MRRTVHLHIAAQSHRGRLFLSKCQLQEREGRVVSVLDRFGAERSSRVFAEFVKQIFVQTTPLSCEEHPRVDQPE
jgi:hypothetical protein